MTTFFSDLDDSHTNHNLGGSERPHELSDPTGSGVPNFKSTQPPSLPLSPSSYFVIPPGLNLAELLDSPVLLNSSKILPSPTTGSFPHEGNQHNVKEEDKSFSSFSFQTQAQSGWNFQETTKQDSFSSGTSMSMSMVVKFENSSSVQSFTPENIAGVQNNHKSGLQTDYNNFHPQAQILSRRSDDGYNWRKYGQKQVKGSENPRSYYKCTYPNCPTKKKVEKSIDGQIIEIVYKSSHNHPKPQAAKRSSLCTSSLAIPPSNHASTEIQNASNGNGQMDLVATPDNSSISMGDDDFEHGSQKSKSGEEFDEDEPDAKKWRIEGENEGISAAGSRTVREPKVVVQTTSDIDILDDGYRWRKYGQKVVKGNPNPRSYYKCTNPGCPVRKHVERASNDLKAVITTYEGKHNHDVPAPRGSVNNSINRSMPTNTTNNSINDSLQSLRSLGSEGQEVFTTQMLQIPENFGFQTGFGNQMESYYMNMNQQYDNVFSSRAKEEPVDDSFFEFLLC